MKRILLIAVMALIAFAAASCMNVKPAEIDSYQESVPQ